MSSLANAIKQKTHKERSQPAARQKYGLLEKHKDYVERAKDFHKKEKVIKDLKRKAEERNPDEFYFEMEHARTKEGIHQLRATTPNKYSQEELRLMKTQDVKYLSLKERVEAEKVSRLRSSLHFIGAPAANKHTVFVEDSRAAADFNPEEYFDTPASMLKRTYNRPRKAALAEGPLASSAVGSRVAGKTVDRLKAASYKELVQRVNRQRTVGKVAARMTMQKEVMAGGRMRKLKPHEMAKGTAKGMKVFKWKRERKT